jgi:hypothetical protein
MQHGSSESSVNLHPQVPLELAVDGLELIKEALEANNELGVLGVLFLTHTTARLARQHRRAGGGLVRVS